MQDISQSLTNSLSRDGQGGMRADLDMGGHALTNLAPGVADTDAATVGQLGPATAVPVGALFDYAGATPPAGYLLCYGQALSRTTYASLFGVIGTAFGAGDGATTFNLPDFRGRVAAGKDNMGGAAASRLTSPVAGSTMGASGGAQSHTLTTAEMPSHSHTVTDPGHHHSVDAAAATTNVVANGVTDTGAIDNTTVTDNATTGITIANTGGGGAHNNVQPTLVVNKIIKV